MNKLEIRTFRTTPNSHVLKPQTVAEWFETIPDERVYTTELDTQLFGRDEFFTNLSLSNNSVSTCRFEIDPLGACKRKAQVFNNFNTSVVSVSGSQLIRGECAVLTNNSAFRTNTVLLSSKTRLMDGLTPLFRAADGSTWQGIRCGLSQPREYFYSDNTQFLAIDSRCKSVASQLFTVSTANLATNALIHKTDVLRNNTNYHVVYCSDTIEFVDDRYPNRSVLTLQHFLKNPCLLLRNFGFENTNCIVASDSNDVVVSQVTINQAGPPVSKNHVLKAHTPKEIRLDLRHDDSLCDKTLDKVLSARVRGQVVALSGFTHENRIYLLQVF
jgi:hypothetical protein